MSFPWFFARMSVVNPANARNKEYAQILSDIAASGKCPFCPGGYTWKNQEILHEDGEWTISHIDPRYQLANTRVHLLLFPRRHITDHLDLTPADWASIHALTTWARAEFEMPAGVLTMRGGDTRYTGGTVVHQHAQFFIPNEIDGELQPVTVRFG